VKPLTHHFFRRDSVTVAQELIGKLLVRDTRRDHLVCRIVETEAYNQEDPASHSFRGLTVRTAPMFEAGGIAYVYFIYGMYDCFNVVTDRAGYGSAVLIRAAEPLAGFEQLWENRFPGKRPPEFTTKPAVSPLILSTTNGPGKLARAMAITRARDNGKDLTGSDLTIQDDGFDVGERVECDVRIGISVGVEKEWRFYLGTSPYVSRRRAGQSPRSSTSRSRSSSEK